MLILTREAGKGIVISAGDARITVMVVAIQGGGRVRLGIEAPKDVAVHRCEVQDAIDREARD